MIQISCTLAQVNYGHSAPKHEVGLDKPAPAWGKHVGVFVCVYLCVYVCIKGLWRRMGRAQSSKASFCERVNISVEPQLLHRQNTLLPKALCVQNNFLDWTRLSSSKTWTTIFKMKYKLLVSNLALVQNVKIAQDSVYVQRLLCTSVTTFRSAVFQSANCVLSAVPGSNFETLI